MTRELIEEAGRAALALARQYDMKFYSFWVDDHFEETFEPFDPVYASLPIALVAYPGGRIQIMDMAVSRVFGGDDDR